MLYVGSDSPWGEVQTVRLLAWSVWQVTTAGHGGVFVGPDRMKAQGMGGEDPWFEEDDAAPEILRRMGVGRVTKSRDVYGVLYILPDAPTFTGRIAVDVAACQRAGYADWLHGSIESGSSITDAAGWTVYSGADVCDFLRENA